MLTCKETSELISARFDRRLNWGERVGLRLHLTMCKYCSAVARQIEMIQKLAKLNRDAGLAALGETQLPDAARKRIVDAVRRADPHLK